MPAEITLLFISIIFLIIGIKLWERGNALLKNGRRVNAIVFKNKFENSRDGGIHYPIVRFLTDKNEWVTQELSIGYSPPKPEGSKVEVIYDPEDPNKVEINSSFQLEILPRLFVGFGLATLVVAALVFLNYI